MFDFISKLIGKPHSDEEFYTVVNAKPVKMHNPLPQMFPALYTDGGDEKHTKSAKAIIKEAEVLINKTLHFCNTERTKSMKMIMHNMALLLEIPAITRNLVWLRKNKMKHEYECTIIMSGLLQTNIFFGSSKLSEHLAEDLMIALLGVLMRYCGVMTLSEDERQTLASSRHFDVSDSRQKELRDHFLNSYQGASIHLAESSSEMFLNLIGKKHKCPAKELKAIGDIIHYSRLITGRTAAHIKQEDLKEIHNYVSYIASTFNFASALSAAHKKPAQVIAEERTRAMSFSKERLIEDKLHRSMDAINDIMKACRCVVLENFQGTERDALYSISDRVLAKEVEVIAELKGPGRNSIRRFVKKDKSPADTDPDLTLVQTQWKCFKAARQIDWKKRITKAKRSLLPDASDDPTDVDLKPVE